MTVLRAERITKTYREGRETVDVLRGVDLTLDAGEVVALEGPSGSGKSTLLSILGCILTPSSGRLVVCNRPIASGDLVAIRKACIGFVFQQYNLVPALTALENVELALRIRGIKGPRTAVDALAAVGLHDRMRFLPRDLSGGQKQRVAIARAIAGDTPVLLADEPTANLDSRSGEQVLSLFRTLAVERRRALLIVTHDPQVRKIADRVLFIRDGALLA
jgi:putative ABC transport system ATP-binding protein